MYRCRVLMGLSAFALAGFLAVPVDAPAFASLPDGRAWEMVSPLNKNGGEINGIGGVVPKESRPEAGLVRRAPDGNAIPYVSLLSFPGSNNETPLGAPLASQYLSERHPGE